MSSSAGLHTQLAAVMESLVHAAVAELQKLVEVSQQVRAGVQADTREKMVSSRAAEAGLTVTNLLKKNLFYRQDGC